MQNDDLKLDLSALDPTRDQLRLQRMAQAIAQRAVQSRLDSTAALVRWWRPALAVAAGLALAAWTPQLFGGSSTSTSASSDPAAALLTWANQGGPSGASEILATFGRKP